MRFQSNDLGYWWISDDWFLVNNFKSNHDNKDNVFQRINEQRSPDKFLIYLIVVIRWRNNYLKAYLIFSRMNGVTQSGYYLQDYDSSYLSIAKCDMHLPYLHDEIEEHVGTIAIRCQFHQGLTSSFCTRRSQKRKKILTT